jgi:adenine-specific DNA-methyltransferase
MEKLKMQTKNFTDENVAKIGELFPNCVTEAANGEEKSIDFDLLKQELSKNIVDGPQERYRLDWPGKREALVTANTPITKTLRPCPEESIDFDETENLFIEGDNLEALKLLQNTYLGKVKMIYIDPPYNTGKDFVYSDNFTADKDEYLEDSGQLDEEGGKLVANTDSNGRFHSDWLSMMYPRLKLARNLLRDDGVIFISIDDNEIGNIEKIAVNVFGSENFLGSFPVVMNLKGNQDAFGFAETHEFIVVATKCKDTCELNHFPLDDEELANWKEDDYGLYKKADTLRRTGQDASRTSRPKGWFPVFIDNEDNVYVTGNDLPKVQANTVLYPINDAGEELSWSWGKQKITKEPHNLIVVDGRSGKNIYKKQRPSIGELPTKKPKSLFYKPEYSTSTATNELKKLLDKKIFDGPKPVPFIKDLALIGSNSDDIILDFFAGSGTTAHAVMQLNEEDGGSRKFIMVQIPEKCNEKSEAFKAGYKTIAEISKERIRRAGTKIKEELNLKKTNGQMELDMGSETIAKDSSALDIGFRVLKVDSSNMADVYYSPEKLKQAELLNFQENIKADRTSEDLLFQVLLDWGVDLTLPITREIIKTDNKEFELFFVDGNSLAACFAKNSEIDEELCRILAERQPQRIVFRDSGFANDDVKINVEQIFKQLSPHTEVKTI